MDDELTTAILLDELEDDSITAFIAAAAISNGRNLEDEATVSHGEDSLIAVAAAVALDDEPVRVKNFYEVTIPMYSDFEFRSHFRMGRTAFQVSSMV